MAKHQNDVERKKHEEEVKKHLELRQQMYLDERKILAAGEEHSADQLDKNILTLSGGALGISLVFLEKIAPHPIPNTLWILYFSWGGLVFSLLAMLSSFLTSQHAHRKQIRILEADLLSEFGEYSGPKNRWSQLTRCLNWLSILGFIFGVCMLLFFSIKNVKYIPDLKGEIKIQPEVIREQRTEPKTNQ